MRILNCPSCGARLSVDQSRLESLALQGVVWIRCPVCRDRFQPPMFDLSEPGPLPLPASEPARSKSGYRLGSGAEPAEARLEVSMPPRLAWRRKLPAIIGGLLVAAMLAAAILVLVSPFGVPEPPAAAEAAPRPELAHYEDGRLAADMASLRQDVTRDRRLDRTVNHRGPEWRFYDYFSRAWAPGACRDLTAIKLWSLKTSEGFKARGLCRGTVGPAPELEVRWADGVTAVVSATALDGSKIVKLAGGR
jgi:hypothetical protein